MHGYILYKQQVRESRHAIPLILKPSMACISQIVLSSNCSSFSFADSTSDGSTSPTTSGQPFLPSDIGYIDNGNSLNSDHSSIPLAESSQQSNGSSNSSDQRQSDQPLSIVDILDPASLEQSQIDLPKVPWGLNTTITVLVVWLLSFWAAAYLAVPTILDIFDIDPHSTLARVQAFRHLLLDILQLGITIFVLKKSLAEYHPRKLGMFRFQLTPWRPWVSSVLGGVILFPLVDWLHRNMVMLLSRGIQQQSSGMGGVVSGSDWVARAMWAFVLAVCAPVWEETMFRGFLLPSLVRYVPAWMAVAASSLVFATVHFTREGFIPLLLLGVIFGASYVRSRNLVAPILLHSLWNLCLLGRILLGAG